MGPLASLLPALREVRASLAAGYLWLLGLWLAYGDDVTRRPETQGLIQELSSLEGVLSELGLGVSLSFVAYLVGTLSEWASSTLLHAVPNRRAWYYKGRLLNTVEQRRKRQSDEGAFRRGETVAPYFFSWESEFGGIRTTLMIEHPLLYNEYDRHRSEAEFRFALLVPLIWLIDIVATTYGASFAMVYGAVIALALQAIKFDRRAEAILIQSVMSKKVQSPYLEHHGIDVDTLTSSVDGPT